jgi:hypothetical protein
MFHILQGSLISKRVNYGYGTSCNVPDFLLYKISAEKRLLEPLRL